jgi:putative intracellular protease/amidase
MKKVLMVLAPKMFRDLEYLVPKAFIEKKGYRVMTVSTEYISTGKFGFEVEHSATLEDFQHIEFDGLLFVGGLGCLELSKSNTLKNMTKNYLNNGKLVASICAAPRLLLDWELVKDRKITGNNWDNNFDNLAKSAGAIPINEDVVVDRNLVTANGPESVEAFSNALLEVLK